MHVYGILWSHCSCAISLAVGVFLQELAHVSTVEQIENVYNSMTA